MFTFHTSHSVFWRTCRAACFLKRSVLPSRPGLLSQREILGHSGAYSWSNKVLKEKRLFFLVPSHKNRIFSTFHRLKNLGHHCYCTHDTHSLHPKKKNIDLMDAFLHDTKMTYRDTGDTNCDVFMFSNAHRRQSPIAIAATCDSYRCWTTTAHNTRIQPRKQKRLTFWLNCVLVWQCFIWLFYFWQLFVWVLLEIASPSFFVCLIFLTLWKCMHVGSVV